MLHQGNSPSAAAVAEMRDAIRRGWIYMHAFLFDAQPEMLDARMFQWGLNATQRLARQLGQPPPRVLSQRDVPGLTRATVPWLAEAGVIGVNVGINGASAPADVPSVRACLNGEMSVPFLWRDEATDTSVIAAFHPGALP